MKIIALIPARAGSKRLPGKNTMALGGKPLVMWAVDAALEAKIFDQIVVSTDCPAVASLTEPWAWSRPHNLATDDTPMLDVVKYVERTVESDMIFLLQPTSPFRTAKDIQNVYSMMLESNGDAVVSVTDGPNDLVFQLGHANRMRPREDIVVANGAIYAITTKALLGGEDWYSGVSYAYRMPKDRSLDIDTQADFELAKAMLERQTA